MRGPKHILALAATLALACPLIVASPQQDKRDGRRNQQERKEEKHDDHRHQNQNQNQSRNQNNQQHSNTQQNFAPQVPGSYVPAHPLNGPAPHAGDWLRHMVGMPQQQQQQQLENDPNFKTLPPAEQQRLRERLQRFNSQPPDEQQRILNRMEVREHMTAQQKQQERQLFQRYRDLPEVRRRAVHNALVELNTLPPDQRQRMLASPNYRARFNDQERDILGQALELGTQPGEMNAKPQ